MRPQKGKGMAADQFPVGLRVLAVDDDRMCLKVLETLLRRCHYDVQTSNQADVALRMLRENSHMFDLVISDVHMPDMDGFELLELVLHETDVPVIMLSVNGDTKTVMKGITNGACDYLLKPVRIQELQNIWQHVVRRKFGTRGCVVNDIHEECNKSPGADSDHVHGQLRKRKECRREEEHGDDVSNVQEEDHPCDRKRPRVVWTVELHTKFVAAVNQLGINKATPKRILELMSVKTLTSANVGSHLQKYRLYLRRLCASASQQGSIYAAMGGRDPFMCMDAFEVSQGFTSPAVLSSFSAHGLVHDQSAVVIKAVSSSESIQNAQPQHEWTNEDDDGGDLSAIVYGNRTLENVTSCTLLPQDLLECTQAHVAVQPSTRAPSASLELLEGVVGASWVSHSQQSALPLLGFSASGLPVQGSFDNDAATRLGDLTVAGGSKEGACSFGGTMYLCLGNKETYYSFAGSPDSFLCPNPVWSSSQLPSNVGAQLSISHDARIFGQSSADDEPLAPAVSTVFTTL